MGVVMNRRLFFRPLLALLLVTCAYGQQPAPEIPTRAESLRQIAMYEVAIKQARSAGASDLVMATMLSRLGSLDVKAGRYGESEAAFEQAISLWRRSPASSGQLAMDM